jgi:hypothetical protein
MMLLHRNSTYRFALVLLVMLLTMNALFFLMDRFYSVVPFDAYLFRVTSFVGLLCLMALVENLLIVFMRKYTLLGVVFVAVCATAILVSPEIKNPIMKALSPFLANKYMRLKTVDIIMLFLLNSVLVSIMVMIMISEKLDHKP